MNTEIKTRDELPEGLCQMYAEKVKKLRKFWINRGGFYTLGAASYQDTPEAYPAIAAAFNPIIEKDFGWLLTYVGKFIADGKDIEVKTLPHLALPSFHIFDHQANGLEGSIHIDEPYERVDLPEGWHSPFSFTLPIELPAGGGGMNYWPKYTDREMDYYLSHAERIPEPTYLAYEVGTMITHSGLFPHQIANPCTLGKDEYRITLQGHGVHLDSGDIVIYF